MADFNRFDSGRENIPVEEEHNPVIKILLTIRSSFLLFMMTLGIILFVIGGMIAEGVPAGMFAIWGVSAVLYALLGVGFLRLIGYT